MSVYGLLVSFGITTLIILQFLGYFLNVYDAAATMAELNQSRRSSLKKLEPTITNVSGNNVYLSIQNYGPVDIPSKHIKVADLFIIYFNEDGVRRIRRLNFGETPGWQIIDVKLGESDEALDPMILSPELEGVWNIGETIYINATLEEAVNSSQAILARFWVVTEN